MPRRDRFDEARLMRWRLPWWQSALLAALVIATVLALAIVATSLVLIIAPIILVALLARRFLSRRRARRDDGRPATRPRVIEGEYEVISVEPRPDPGKRHEE